jgi:hypothetical protein
LKVLESGNARFSDAGASLLLIGSLLPIAWKDPPGDHLCQNLADLLPIRLRQMVPQIVQANLMKPLFSARFRLGAGLCMTLLLELDHDAADTIVPAPKAPRCRS